MFPLQAQIITQHLIALCTTVHSHQQQSSKTFITENPLVMAEQEIPAFIYAFKTRASANCL